MDTAAVLAWRVRSGSSHQRVGEAEWTAFGRSGTGMGDTQAMAALQATDKRNKMDRGSYLPMFALCLRDDASVAWLTQRAERLGMAVQQAPGGAWMVTGRVNLSRTAGVKLLGYAYEAATVDVLEVDELKGLAIAKAVYSAAEAMRAAVDLNERRSIAKGMGLLARRQAR